MSVEWFKQREARPVFRSDRRLYLNDDKSAVVEASDPSARFLLVAAGGEIDDDVARRYGLLPPIERAAADDASRVPDWLHPHSRAAMAAEVPEEDRPLALEAEPPTKAPEAAPPAPEPEGGSPFSDLSTGQEEAESVDDAAKAEKPNGPDEPVVMEKQQEAAKAAELPSDKAVRRSANK